MTAINYARYLNKLSSCRKPSPLREMTSLLAKSSPSVIFLATGLPNPDLFPFENATFTLRGGKTLEIDKKTLNRALQYGPTPGYPELVDQLRKFQFKYHRPPRFENFDILVTTGSQDGLCKCIEMMITPGDYILIPEPTYPGTLGIFNPYRPKYLPVQTDRDGLVPESLKSQLQKWDPALFNRDNCIIPKFLYINPTGANPTGTTLSLDRRKEIYKIAQDYELLILEDDPYYFMQFTDTPVPSFLSLDVDGRVIRFDSFSKILSAGMRLGFVTGPKPLMERINYHMQISVLHSSNLSQVLVNELLKQWGDEGFENHTKKVQEFYKKQKDLMLKYAKRWLRGLADWNNPESGMFLWMKILKVEDTYPMIMEKALEKEVVLVPGRHFLVDSTKASPYLRASFSLATEEKMNKGFQRLAELITEEQVLKTEIGHRKKVVSPSVFDV